MSKSSLLYKTFLRALSLFCLLNLTANMILLFTHCQPTQSQWDFSVPGHCLDKWILVSFAIYTGGTTLSLPSYGGQVDATAC